MGVRIGRIRVFIDIVYPFVGTNVGALQYREIGKGSEQTFDTGIGKGNRYFFVVSDQAGGDDNAFPEFGMCYALAGAVL